MTSKEALEKLEDNGRDYLLPVKVFKIIKQDLERLEKLEQFVDIYKNTNKKFELLIQDKATNLPSPTLEQELLRKEVLENEYSR